MDFQQSFAPAPVKTNTNATVSMIAGIVGWVLVALTACLNFGILPLITVATGGVGVLTYVCVIPLGCVSPIAWLVAVITGHIAKSKIKQTGEGGSGKATAGLIMGYIGLGLLVIALCIVIILAIALAFGMSIPLLSGFNS
jgi:hypothetical protein